MCCDKFYRVLWVSVAGGIGSGPVTGSEWTISALIALGFELPYQAGSRVF